MIHLLEPIFHGELAALGEALACAPVPPAGAVRLHDLLDQPVRLEQVLRRYAHYRHANQDDLRPVASVWSMEYLALLLPPVAAGATLLEHVFPVQPEHIWIELEHSGLAQRFHIAKLGRPAPGDATLARYDALLWQHLAPLFIALSAISRLPQKILWANAARYLDMLLEHAEKLTRSAPNVVADRDILLRQRHWPATAPDQPSPRLNPLYSAKRGQLGAPRQHPLCCLAYRLPNSPYCTGCPLDRQAQPNAA